MKKRETRIDIIRGIAMLTILLNHTALPLRAIYHYSGPVIPTLTEYGYSSAASLFVAMSGYMVGMVYLKRPNPIRSVLTRASQLYLINAGLLCALVALAYLAPAANDSFWQLRPIVEPPYMGIVKFLALLDAPAFTDILQLYVTLMLVTSAAILLIRRSVLLLAVCSIGLWALMQVLGFLLPSTSVPLSNGHSLNVLAWQLTFFLPMIAGKMKLHEKLFAWFEKKPRAVAALWFLVFIAGVSDVLDVERFIPASHTLMSRQLNGVIWIGHSLLVLLAYAGLLTWLLPHLQRWPFQLLASLGRNSLNVFVASTPIMYVATLAFGTLGLAGYLLSVGSVVTLCLLVAAWGDQRKQRKSAQQTSQPLTAP